LSDNKYFTINVKHDFIANISNIINRASSKAWKREIDSQSADNQVSSIPSTSLVIVDMGSNSIPLNLSKSINKVKTEIV